MYDSEWSYNYMLKYNIDRNILSLDFGFSGGNESRPRSSGKKG